MDHTLRIQTAATSLAFTLALSLAGCKSAAPAVDDNTLNMNVMNRLVADQSLYGATIQAPVVNGVVTLNGTVLNDAERTTAAADAAQIAGVHTVVNNLVVQAVPPPSATAFPAPAPQKAPKPSASVPQRSQAQMQPAPPAPIVRSAPQSGPAPVAQMAPPPPPPAAPVIHDITLPAGTSLPVRITQNLDSATSQTGDKFTGVIASDIIVDGLVVLPQGTPVAGHVDAVQDAGHFKGSSLLTISLSSISQHGQRIDVATEAFSKQGEGRGKNTAEKVGGGAAVGAILGGIFGGGKGAAIGAAAGGGVGAGANGITRGQQVQIPSETVVRFKLTDSINVRVAPGSGSSDGYNPSLERRNNQ
jgi:BON domain